MSDRDPRDIEVDVDPPDMPLGRQLTLTLDDPNAAVILEAELRENQETPEIWVNVIARDPQSINLTDSWAETPLWGAAAQLTFPPEQLRFIRSSLPDGPNNAALGGEEPGRVYWYHGSLEIPRDATRATLMTMRFEVLNPQDRSPITLGFIPRFSSIRGLKNQRLKYQWSGGTLMFEVEGATP